MKSIDYASVGDGLWKARSGEPWRWYAPCDENGYYETPELDLYFRAAETSDGFAVNGLMILAKDGRALSARDLRRIRFPWAAVIRRALSGYESKVVAPARPGPKGHPLEHWREVYGLWQQATREAPHATTKWMQSRYEPRMGEATIRRWVAKAKELHEKGQL